MPNVAVILPQNQTANTNLTVVNSTQTTPTGAGFTVNAFNNVLTISLSIGTWSANALLTANFLTLLTAYEAVLSLNSGNLTTDHQLGVNDCFGPLGTATAPGCIAIPSLIVTCPVAATLYLKVKPIGVTGNIFCARMTAFQIG